MAKKKRKVKCPVHDIAMRKHQIIWGLPAEIKPEYIYGGCCIFSGIEMPEYGYICSECEKQKHYYHNDVVYVIIEGKLMKMNEFMGKDY